ncbi:FAD-dependent monooxygenase [Mycobacterium saskatchewanense]|nr:FAD-dependent monooxygenase [Mycobacterium saskatchewanense]
MNLGITDAAALSAALARVLGGGSDAALDAYSTTQRERAERVLKLAGRLTRIATLPRPLRPVRNSGRHCPRRATTACASTERARLAPAPREPRDLAADLPPR